jgi:hypothetical protein
MFPVEVWLLPRAAALWTHSRPSPAGLTGSPSRQRDGVPSRGSSFLGAKVGRRVNPRIKSGDGDDGGAG